MLETVYKNSWVRAIALILVLILLCFSIYALSFVLVPLLLAFTFAYILDPLVDHFETRNISRPVTIGAIAVLAVIALVSVPIYVLPSLIRQANGLYDAARSEGSAQSSEGIFANAITWSENQLPLEEFVESAGWRDEYEDWAETEEIDVSPTSAETPENGTIDDGEATDDEAPQDDAPEDGAGIQAVVTDDEPAQDEDEGSEPPVIAADAQVPARVIIAHRIKTYVEDTLRQSLTDHGATVAGAGQSAGSGIASFFASVGGHVMGLIVFLGNFAIFAFVAGYLLKDYDHVVVAMGELVPPKWRSTTFRIVGKIDVQLRGFLRGQLTVCTALAIMYAIGMVIAGVPFALLIAVFGGIASLIPFFGVVLTFVPAATLTLLHHGFDGHIIALIIVFVAVQALEGNVITPTIMGQTVGLHPVWVILAVMVFGSLLGFTGLLIAVPLAAMLKVIVEEALDFYRSSVLFAEDG
jgi:predicted PurR-regulated permease PerM